METKDIFGLNIWLVSTSGVEKSRHFALGLGLCAMHRLLASAQNTGSWLMRNTQALNY